MKLAVAFVLAIALCAVAVNAKSKYDDVKNLSVGVKFKPEKCDKKTKSGDTLKIHYTGTLTNGEKFDSSVDRGDPFQFTLGRGQVIKGWDEGLTNMCIGEKRKLVIPSNKGYGERGSPPKIPGGATLIFETELIDIL
eukprot:tig00021348_g20557.t1